MKSTICPFLGLKDDPSTTLNFPSDGNYCHRASAIPPVSRDYQHDVCLTAGHVNCPVFMAGGDTIPPGLTLPNVQDAPSQRTRWIALTLLLLMAGVLISSAWQSESRGAAFSNTGNSSISLSTDNIKATSTNAEEYSPLQRLITPVVANPSLAPCTQPDGWVEYAVKPTDTLFLLSLVYGVSMNDLQMVNCLDQDAVLKPGMTIFVPGAPTATITPSPTPTPTSARLPAVQPTQRNRPRQQATREPQPTATQPPANPQPPQPTATQPPANPQPPKPTATNPPPPTSTRPAPAPTRTPQPTDTPNPTKEPKATHAPKPTKTPRN